MAKPISPTQRFLREYIAEDAPAREKSVAGFMAGVSAVSAVLALALLPVIGSQLAGALAAVLGALVAWYLTLVRLISRGWFHPLVSWLNVAIEVSAPSLIFLIDLRANGAAYALTAPPLVIWGSLIGLSGLRGNRALSLCAGALAAGEYALLYALAASPRLPAGALVTLQAPMIATRVVLLFASAVLTVVFVAHLNRKAEEAFAALRARDVFGKYLLHERIGAGGMAEVFRATYSPEGGFEKIVAIKRVLPSYAHDESFLAMFRAEAELCSRFSHPCIVQVLDFGRFGETYFLAMEYVEGAPLQRLLHAWSGRGLPIDAVVSMGVALCEALDYLHQRRGSGGGPLGLIHRDVNPPNILVSLAGEVKLTDFGIARARGSALLTQVGLIKGKPGYLAPEQAAGEAIDSRVDLFALGTTLWESLVGERLFPSSEVDAMEHVLFERRIPPPSERRADVPPELDQVVMGLLERELSRRTATAGEALTALRHLALSSTGGAAALATCVAQARAGLVPAPSPAAAAPASTPDAETAITALMRPRS
jgi:serine/threonine-protein kinase